MLPSFVIFILAPPIGIRSGRLVIIARSTFFKVTEQFYLFICFYSLLSVMSVEGIAREVNKYAGWAWNKFPGLPHKEYEKVNIVHRFDKN